LWTNPVKELQHKLIVSCQAFPGEALYGSEHMVAMAQSAVEGGAGGIRANGPADIRAIKAMVKVPVIGILKRDYEGYGPRITPTVDEVQAVLEAGADIVAVDATDRLHPGDVDLREFLKRVRALTAKPIMGDISTLEEALIAEECGLDLVGTTLNGYTEYTVGEPDDQPNLDLLEAVARRVSIPVIAEGRIWEPRQAKEALDRGAWAVTVGGAITRPQLITKRFVQFMVSTKP
jgi:N-acylglucosamine-6-phosphate 2-epimerase